MRLSDYKKRPDVINFIKEIGERVPPYFKKDRVNITGEDPAEFTFDDDKGNVIKVLFHNLHANKEKAYEVEYYVNGKGAQAFESSIKHLFEILSTVIEVINAFLDKYDPDYIKIDGLDKIDAEGQKNSIYKAYAKAFIKDKDYKMIDDGNGFIIRKIKTTL